MLMLCIWIVLQWDRHHGTESTREKNKIVSMFEYAWSAYQSHAWGKDELLPLSRRGTSRFMLCATMVDALDTMWLMGLHEHFDHSVEYLQKHLDTSVDHEESLFETTIRILGGLLSAHALSGRSVLLEKATSLGARLLAGFQTGVTIPPPAVNLKSGVGRGTSCLSEPTTLQLEFRHLALVNRDPRVQAAVDAVDLFMCDRL